MAIATSLAMPKVKVKAVVIATRMVTLLPKYFLGFIVVLIIKPDSYQYHYMQDFELSFNHFTIYSY